MIKVTFTIAVFLLVVVAHAKAQGHKPDPTPGFISVGIGPFWSDHSGFAERYGSQAVLVGGVAGGLPVARRVHLYGKVTYIATRSLDASAQFIQWLFNAGAQYSPPLFETVNVGLQGGVAYSVVSEDVSLADGSSSSFHGGGLQGFFVGLGAGWPLYQSPWCLVVDVQYNTSRSDASSFAGAYGGLSASIGLRYRFLKDRRGE